jgi:hypothetical protein
LEADDRQAEKLAESLKEDGRYDRIGIRQDYGAGIAL